MRLHLLQAIVLYHQNKRTEAIDLFRRAEIELNKLKVDENSLVMLVELGKFQYSFYCFFANLIISGYSPAEARLGLRATNDDINLAANYINENRRNRSESRRKAMADKILERYKLYKLYCHLKNIIFLGKKLN